MSKIQTNKLQHTATGAAEFTLPTADGTSGQAIITNASGALSFASSVTLARFGRPFLQPLYGLASGRLYKVDDDAEFVPPKGKRGERGLHPRVRWALMWWV